MKFLLRLFATVHAVIALLLLGMALAVIAIAVNLCWHAFGNGLGTDAAQDIIEAIGLIAVAIVAVQIAQTIVEEEVVREAHVSAPTRVRRFLSRFLVVLVVAIAIEGLVATFKAIHEDMTMLPYAASILLSVGVLVAGWGIFIKLNTAAEELEPEAMEEAKGEDSKVR
jgi:hypothetical protein